MSNSVEERKGGKVDGLNGRTYIHGCTQQTYVGLCEPVPVAPGGRCACTYQRSRIPVPRALRRERWLWPGNAHVPWEAPPPDKATPASCWFSTNPRAHPPSAHTALQSRFLLYRHGPKIPVLLLLPDFTSVPGAYARY